MFKLPYIIYRILVLSINSRSALLSMPNFFLLVVEIRNAVSPESTTLGIEDIINNAEDEVKYLIRLTSDCERYSALSTSLQWLKITMSNI